MHHLHALPTLLCPIKLLNCIPKHSADYCPPLSQLLIVNAEDIYLEIVKFFFCFLLYPSALSDSQLSAKCKWKKKIQSEVCARFRHISPLHATRATVALATRRRKSLTSGGF